ncbi:McrB family protein [Aliarcobacter cryaerophilus]|uniref:McrB family protein n=1 Tax=Aliarcobacter cryaerophilus TaxID=28198 RepID=UPI003AF334F9
MNKLGYKILEKRVIDDILELDKNEIIELNLHNDVVQYFQKYNIKIDDLEKKLNKDKDNINISFSVDNENKEVINILIDGYNIKCSTKYNTHLFAFYSDKEKESTENLYKTKVNFKITQGNASSKNNKDNNNLIKLYNFFRKFNKTSITTKNNILNTIFIKNIMLYGSPGVGKTHNYKRLITMIEEGNDEKTIFYKITQNETTNNFDNSIFETIKNEKRIEFVTFHQNYSYEDFIEGFKPKIDSNIKIENGIFKNICEDADKDQSKNFYIVIDEINRGNISKIFGELITLIEEDKRDAYEVTLPYSKDKFKIPSNLYIIATMNSTDKSIATIDIALRRRFTFLKMKPNSDLVENQEAKDLMKELNKHISNAISEDYALGHSYFMKIENEDDLKFVKEYKIKPLLEEYFYGDEDNYKKALKILGFEDELNKK